MAPHINTAMLKEMAKKIATLGGIMDASPDIILVVDRLKQIVQFSMSGEKTLGYKKIELLGQRMHKIFKRTKSFKELIRLMSLKGSIDEHVVTARTKNQEEIPLSAAIRPLMDDERKDIGWVVNLHDIRRRVSLERSLRRQMAELESIVNTSGAMIVTTNPEGFITKINPTGERLLGVSSKEMIGRTMNDFYVDKNVRRKMLKKLKTRDNVHYEAEIIGAGGEKRMFFVALSTFRSPLSGKVLGTVGISHDITDKHRAETQLRRMLITDEMTGLFNRRHFFDRIRDIHGKFLDRQTAPYILAFMDMDGFKKYNDTLGHQRGDELLAEFGSLCIQTLVGKPSPMAYRYGGDEFVCIFQRTSLDSAREMLESLRRRLKDKSKGMVTLSVGLSRSRNTDSFDKVIERADRSVYEAKNTGRNKVVFLEE